MRVAHRAALVVASLAVVLFPMTSPAQAQQATAVVTSQTAAMAKGATLAAKTWKFAFASTATLDRNGVEPSLYRGKFFRPSVERVRKCIVQRESSGHYTSVSRSGYRGAYQMSGALGRGVTWMMLKEHRALLGSNEAQQAMVKLRTTPISKWTRYWQDAAFSTIYNWKKTKSGAKHWRGGRWHC
ncbi:MAG TPA: hypothetical protein DDY88_06350 [Actinobacteria bacterium]|nr:hypothetical protein [Actinomycetota bacterium]